MKTNDFLKKKKPANEQKNKHLNSRHLCPSDKKNNKHMNSTFQDFLIFKIKMVT